MTLYFMEIHNGNRYLISVTVSGNRFSYFEANSELFVHYCGGYFRVNYFNNHRNDFIVSHLNNNHFTIRSDFKKRKVHRL